MSEIGGRDQLYLCFFKIRKSLFNSLNEMTFTNILPILYYSIAIIIHLECTIIILTCANKETKT